LEKIVLWEPTFSKSNKADLLRDIAIYLENKKFVSNYKLIVKEVEYRESIGSTLICPNMVIPHIKSKTVIKPILLFVKLQYYLTDWCVDAKVDRLIFTLIPDDCSSKDLINIKDFYIGLSKKNVLKIFSKGNKSAIEKIMEIKGD
jgi:mannitol/fructose-specific phosphotransferase system IIA component (Ntr-type)